MAYRSIGAVVLLAAVNLGSSGSAIAAADSERMILAAHSARHIRDDLMEFISEKGDVAAFRSRLGGIKQRTKTRQVGGITNINIMEWTTQASKSPTMDGFLVYLKNMKAEYALLDKQAMNFIRYPPRIWDHYGELAEIAEKYSKGNIDVINLFVIKLYLWFKAHKNFIGRFGGIIVFYEQGDRATLVIYSDRNGYPENNVSGFLTDLKNLKGIELSEDVFIVDSGRHAFQELVLEKEDGPIGIEAPYILYDVPGR